MDANLLHISFEGRHLEDPAAEAEESMWRWTVSPEKAPNKAEYIDIDYVKGDPVAINGKKMKPHEILAKLNELGGKHGIGRLDLVENRYVGMKSRGCYETPGGTILLKAHRAIESITLDREVAHLKDDLMPRYASLIYNGYWWSPERRALQTLIDHTQEHVNGSVRLKLYKGNVIVVGRDSLKDSLFDPTIATFEDDAGAYDQKDAAGFIKLNALRMRIGANRDERKLAKAAKGPAKKSAAKSGVKKAAAKKAPVKKA
jgi:argininosuccinate synthase